jgi:CheY-like chemotaxis protein
MSANRKPRLLIAEDDPAARELVETAARRSGAFSRIEVVEDGQAVLNHIWPNIVAERREELPDIVLTDLNMPGLTGIELTRDLKAHPETSAIPVAVITSFDNPSDRAMAHQAGCSAYYERPAHLAELTAVLTKIGALWPGQPPVNAPPRRPPGRGAASR